MRNIFFIAYEGDEQKTEQKQETTGTPAPKTFTQDELNKIVAKEKKALGDKLSKLTELSSLTEQQQKELNELRSSLQTAEEQKAEELKTWQKKYETETKTLAEQAETWKKRYSDSRIKGELVSAFGSTAHDPEQFVELFASKAQIVEDKGELHVKVPFVVEEDGKKVTKMVTPSDLQKALYDNAKYANLFKGKGTGGTGGGNAGGGQPLSSEEYIKQRLAGKIGIQ